jgi:hypothetical protein
MPWDKSVSTGTTFDDNGNAHDVDFKTNDSKGETLIANHSVNEGNSSTFDRQSDGSGGRHDHYGDNSDRWSSNDNGTDRGYYTGPGSR